MQPRMIFVLVLPLLLLNHVAAGDDKPKQKGQRSAKKKTAEAPLEIKGAATEVYKEVGDVKLRLHVFQPADHKVSDRRPAIVFFFGGGWVGGSPQQFVPHAKHLAEQGMVTIVADYRVRSRQGTTPFECVADGKSCVRWIRQHAAKLGLDPEKLAAGGGSAGGHVAAATGNLPGLDEESEDKSISSKPNALVLFNPVYDNGPDGYGHDRVKDRYQEISPLHNIRNGAPPTIVFLGTKDKLIPVATAKAYEAKMKEVGSRCDTHLFEGQPHGFFNEARSKEHYAETVRLMDDFLVSLQYIDSSATHTSQSATEAE